MNKTVKNILIAVGVGILVGILLGGVLPMIGISLSSTVNSIGVGAAIGITFALLNNRKDS